MGACCRWCRRGPYISTFPAPETACRHLQPLTDPSADRERFVPGRPVTDDSALTDDEQAC
jgi:hypothetical protein